VLGTCHSVAAEATNLLPWPAGRSSMGFEMLNWSSSLARWTLRRGTPRPPTTTSYLEPLPDALIGFA